MKTNDFQNYLGCVKTEYTGYSVKITCFLSIKKSVYKVLDKHWWTIVGQTLANEGIITLRESYGPRIPAQIVLHREITWKALQDSPAYEGKKAYRYLKDLLADYQKIYSQEIKDELYREFIENN